VICMLQITLFFYKQMWI